MKMISAAAAAASAVVLGLAFTPGAGFAHKIYQLQGNQWAIICGDGTGYSFSGSAGGAQEIAGLLCAGGFTVSASGGGAVKDVVAVTRGEMHPADKFLVRAANGAWALRPGAVPPRSTKATERSAILELIGADPATGADPAGSEDLAIDEEGLHCQKADKKGKGTVTSGRSSGTSSNAGARTGDCTVRPGRPGSTKPR